MSISPFNVHFSIRLMLEPFNVCFVCFILFMFAAPSGYDSSVVYVGYNTVLRVLLNYECVFMSNYQKKYQTNKV